METLKVPAKFSKCGIKVKCLKCKYQLGVGKCHQNDDKPQSISKCQHKDKHRYNLVVCIPNSSNARRTKILETKDFDAALAEMSLFKQELQLRGYHKVEVKTEIVKPTYLSYAADYLDCMNGVNTYEHLARKRSAKHISENKSVLELFGTIMQRAGYNIEILRLNDIKDAHVEMFYKYLKHERSRSESLYNRYMVIMKAFFNWCIEIKEHQGKNPFAKAQLTFTKSENKIFTKVEFDKILAAIKSEYGGAKRGNVKRDYYKPWLANAYRLSLYTGERGEPLVSLKWCDLVNYDGVELFGISNLKVNRIMTGKDIGQYHRYIPVTDQLKELLIELGYHDKKGSDAYILEVDTGMSRKHLLEFIARSFSHYAGKAGVTGLTLKNLRKTYISSLTAIMGDKARIFTGHGDANIAKHHYLSQEFLASNIKSFRIL